MMITRMFAALTLAATVSACTTTETATRDVPLDTATIQPISAPLKVVDVTVDVPRTLRASEANLYFPNGDIVWREDPIGDRHEQVKAIIEAGLEKGIAEMSGGTVPVELHVEVTRFHALTEKARYTVGGWHSVQFEVSLKDAETGSVLLEPELIKADFRAFGGSRAIAAEQSGLTQKVRITDRVAEVIQQVLSDPSSEIVAQMSTAQALDQL